MTSLALLSIILIVSNFAFPIAKFLLVIRQTDIAKFLLMIQQSNVAKLRLAIWGHPIAKQ
jgi:hypothetical protein